MNPTRNSLEHNWLKKRRSCPEDSTMEQNVNVGRTELEQRLPLSSEGWTDCLSFFPKKKEPGPPFPE